jgi:hypothetical protein
MRVLLERELYRASSSGFSCGKWKEPSRCVFLLMVKGGVGCPRRIRDPLRLVLGTTLPCGG